MISGSRYFFIFSLFLTFFNLVSFIHAQDKRPEGIYADMETSKGLVSFRLAYEKAPLTVMNFIGLAEGILKNNQKAKGVPFYDGLGFHYVKNDFVLIGGCPIGDGTGGPGYTFRNEFNDSLKHSGPGILSMANSGADSNGSQFFITFRDTSALDNLHSVFGKVIGDGMKVINSIQAKDKIKSIKIVRIGEKAKSFKVTQERFDRMKTPPTLFNIAKRRWPDLKKMDTGLMYIVNQEGLKDTKKPSKGSMVSVHYTGKLLNGQIFDSSVRRGQAFEFPVGKGQVIKGWDIGIMDMVKGEKRTFIIPPELGYGLYGKPPAIPGNAALVFDVELIDIN